MKSPSNETNGPGSRMAVYGTVVLVGVAMLCGCSRTTRYGEATGTGLLTGYEIGNEQDKAAVRKDRPGYKRHE